MSFAVDRRDISDLVSIHSKIRKSCWVGWTSSWHTKLTWENWCQKTFELIILPPPKKQCRQNKTNRPFIFCLGKFRNKLSVITYLQLALLCLVLISLWSFKWFTWSVWLHIRGNNDVNQLKHQFFRPHPGMIFAQAKYRQCLTTSLYYPGLLNKVVSLVRALKH